MDSYECYAFDVFCGDWITLSFLDELNIPLFAMMDDCSFLFPLEFNLVFSQMHVWEFIRTWGSFRAE